MNNPRSRRLFDLRDEKWDSRLELKRFTGLLAVNGDIVAGFALPGSSTFFISLDTITVGPTALIDVGSRTLSIAAGPANKIHNMGTFNQGQIIKKAAAAPGIISVYIAGSFNKPLLIARG
jgi:hypothetical protein